MLMLLALLRDSMSVVLSVSIQQEIAPLKH
jgi:hypothetical protein